MAIEVRRLAYALGAEIRGLDPRQPLDDASLAAVRQAWHDHLILLFRDVDWTIDQHIAFTRQFGELELHGDRGLRGDQIPEVFRVTNRVTDGKRSVTASVGREWHSDGSFTTCPSGGSMLHCRALPAVGGNTLFANMYRAYDTLSPALRAIIDTLYVVNDVSLAPEYQTMPAEQVAQSIRDNPPVRYPLVRTHPGSGRKALYLNEMLTREIWGMTREESRRMVRFLCDHAVRAENTYRHIWRVGDLILWDNRCTIHLAPADYDPDELRDMVRTTLKGESIGVRLNPDGSLQPVREAA